MIKIIPDIAVKATTKQQADAKMKIGFMLESLSSNARGGTKELQLMLPISVVIHYFKVHAYLYPFDIEHKC